MIWLLAVACLVASVPAGLRWHRVAQREHYLAPATSRFAVRWWSSGVDNLLLSLLALAGMIGSFWDVRVGLLVPLAQVGPLGLGVRGSTSPLVWTGRAKRLAAISAALLALLTVVGAATGLAPLVVAGLLILPALVDVGLVVLGPLERRAGSRWVNKAKARLRAVAPTVVAITGSYGKTTTKNYLHHLISGSLRTVASPASFNNRMGLARSINEGLTPGTEVFIAEMGTYGAGEIAEMCSWVTPRISAIIAIGPVHLERFGTEDRIVEAKSEILDRAEIGVLCVDDERLAALAEERRGGLEVVEVSARGEIVTVGGDPLVEVPEGRHGQDLAVALGIALALGVERGDLLSRVSDLPVAEHRLSVGLASSGVTVIDDTFNSNPAGARHALDLLLAKAANGRSAIVTPGMVELGPVQAKENEGFAREAAAVVDHLVVVGRTNRPALLRGAADGRASVTVVGSRDDAVAWVRGNLGPGDAVLYENDLPDHYP